MSAFDLDRLQRDARVAAMDYHDELDSTNTRALELVAAGERRLPLLVLAERQAAGRGRGQNRWWTGSGGLAFSLLIDGAVADVPKKSWPLVSLTAALAIAESLESLVPAGVVRIKWPNDVYLNGRKVCGILVETSALRPGVLVIGVGVNVNNSTAEAPPELRGHITSLSDASSRAFHLTDVLLDMLWRLADRLPQAGGETWQLADAWRQRCLLQGRTVHLDTGTQGITGVCQGIDDQGALLLLTEVGIQRCYGGVVGRIL